MGRGEHNQTDANHLLYGPRRRGGGPILKPQKVRYRPLYLGLTALAVMTTSETDLENKEELSRRLAESGGTVIFKAAERGLNAEDITDLAMRTFYGDIEDHDLDYEGPPPSPGTPLAFSAEQSLYIHPPEGAIRRANKALLVCFPEDLSIEDANELIREPALAFCEVRLTDTLANLFHVARVRNIDIDQVKQLMLDRAALFGLKENRVR